MLNAHEANPIQPALEREMDEFANNIGGLFFIFFSAFSLADTFFQAEFMKPAEAEKKWGVKLLNKDLFRTGDHNKRESMAVDMVKKIFTWVNR